MSTRLDLDATVQGYARTRRLIPVFGPEPERWFEVDVVVDDAISMTVWDNVITEFIRLLHQVGAFRSIRRWSLTTTHDPPVLRDVRGEPMAPDRLRSSDQRRTILVLSDCCSDEWFTAPPWDMLRELAQTTSVALINPLPSKMWAQTGSDLPAVRVGPGPPGCRNLALRYRVPTLFSAGSDSDRRWLPVPIMTLTPHTLGQWASTLMRSDPTGCDAVLIPPNGHPELMLSVPDDQVKPPTAQDLIESFFLIASPPAVRLVTLCAPFTHISVPVLDVIRQALVPEATIADVAEVVVGGLFAISRHDGQTALRFRDGVQDELRNMLGVHDAWRTYRALTRHLANHSDATGSFLAVIADSDGPLKIPSSLLPFAEASRDLRRLLTQDQDGRKTQNKHADEYLAPPNPTFHMRTTESAMKLAAAVVKVACKIWLKNSATAADPEIGFAEIIHAHVSVPSEQRRLQRFFEELEERVAHNLLINRDVDWDELQETWLEASAMAAADTLDRTRLTNKDLGPADLDTARLISMVNSQSSRLNSGLSQTATELYETILYECCAFVVEVANALPVFEVGVFGNILSRRVEILRRIDQRLGRHGRLDGASAEASETFEQAYLRLVADRLDRTEIFGVPIRARVRSSRLSVAYVNLSVRSHAFPDQARVAESAALERRVTSIEEALGGVTRAFVRGEAGSGKTTLLQWLAVRCARREFDGPMRDWNGCVPLFISLRRYSGADLPPPEMFVQSMGQPIADKMPPDWVRDLLRSGRAVLLVDGVDELPESQRRPVREWLLNLLSTYPNARYVVTSRPAATPENWLNRQEFDDLTIEPMSTATLNAFVAHWHAAQAEGVTNATDLQHIGATRDALVHTIKANRYLRMLATSPLMAALICALHLDLQARLPQDPMGLYSATLEMLLERRDAERGIRMLDRAISSTEKTLMLADLAYWLIRNGRSNLSDDRALERLTVQLTSMPHVQASARDVLHHLLERSGALRSPASGQIEFTHRTFRDFLAARAAVEADDIDLLVRKAHHDQWRDVVLMAVGHGGGRQSDELLRGILSRADTEPGHQRVLLSLAVEAIQYARQLSPDLRRRLQELSGQEVVSSAAAEPTGKDESANEQPSGETTATATEQVIESSLVNDPTELAATNADPKPTDEPGEEGWVHVGRLEQWLGPRAYRILAEWSAQNHMVHKFVRAFDSGVTAAKVAAVDRHYLVEGRSERLALKLDRFTGTDVSTTEYVRHRQALHESGQWVDQHLARLVGPPIPVGDGWWLTFQGVAGNLDQFTVLGALMRELHEADELSCTPAELVVVYESVVSGVLGDWVGKPRIKYLSVPDLIRAHFAYRLADGKPLRQMLDSENEPLLALLRDHSLTDGIELAVPVGSSHGDLHVENVLVRVRPVAVPADFRLIDLANREDAAPLSRDPAHLLMHMINLSLRHLGTSQLAALRQVLLDPASDRRDHLPSWLRDIIIRIYEAGERWIEPSGFGPDWRLQRPLSLYAAALMVYVRRTTRPEDKPWLTGFIRQAAETFLSTVKPRSKPKALAAAVRRKLPERPPQPHTEKFVVGQEAESSNRPVSEIEGALRHFVEEVRLLIERDPIEGFQRWSALHTELAQRGHFDICDDMLLELKGMNLPGYGLGIVRYAEGWMLDRSGDWADAIERYAASLQAFNDANVPLDVPILTQIGSIYQDQGRFDDAQEAYERALGSADDHGRALLLNNLGGLYALRDQPAEARKHFEDAKTLLEQTDDQYNLAAVLVGLANLARDDGELQESADQLVRATVIFRDLGRATAMATAIASLALTYHTAGRLPEAAETYRTALDIFVAHKDRGNTARTLANMALTSAATGDKQQAIGYLKQAIAEYRDIGDRHGEAIALENLRKFTK